MQDVIQKMQDEGESRNWNWDKHCTKFHQQIRIIDEWTVAGLAMPMSAEDPISAFLKTIPKDCKNSKLLIAKGITEGDRSRFPTLVGNVIPLTLSINTKEFSVQAVKRMIANTSFASGQPPRSAVTLVEALGGAPVDRLLGSAAWLATKWWGPPRASITKRKSGMPCPRSRRTRWWSSARQRALDAR
jgi:hypothetical protein